MKDPGGFKLDGVYQNPSSALVEHPGLLLIVCGVGIVVALFSSQLCASAVYTSRCTGNLELLGFALAGLGGIPYAIVRGRRIVRNSG